MIRKHIYYYPQLPGSGELTITYGEDRMPHMDVAFTLQGERHAIHDAGVVAGLLQLLTAMTHDADGDTL